MYNHIIGGVIMRFIQCVQNDNEKVSVIDTINAIKEADFDGVFIQWYNKQLEVDKEEQLKLCLKLGLKVPFVHLDYSKIQDIWVDGEDGDILVEKYIADLDKCHQCGVSLVMMHLTPYSTKPVMSMIAIERFRKIVKTKKIQ